MKKKINPAGIDEVSHYRYYHLYYDRYGSRSRRKTQLALPLHQHSLCSVEHLIFYYNDGN